MPNKNTLFVGKVSRRFSALPSTNDYAANWLLRERPAEGAAILADHQTAGRGQMGNTWDTESGQNLTVSVIFYPTFLLARDQFELNQALALAVRDAVANFTEKPVIVKWPNDILIGERKICGILIQNSLSGPNIQSSIVGMGINVNQEAFAPGLSRASSLYLETGQKIDLNDLMLTLFAHLETRYLQLRQGGIDNIRTDYLQHLYRRNERRQFAYPDGRQFYGTITGVDKNGKLKIETGGQVELFAIKDVVYVY
ncbi:biotin--[acetyl-CoA-carboxylase] ligase [Flavilitoribacter nigricans]|uniref:biotin--[acetyl-CoA-carboxylase] ligase n=1 Tax=Flavilitoribacter nigricans TaxID=70997 RepID=UPI001474BB53|nr:biotin--[acetyl-CoA-carboxylase] ligase [Flavilitoribacter nigricans]